MPADSATSAERRVMCILHDLTIGSGTDTFGQVFAQVEIDARDSRRAVPQPADGRSAGPSRVELHEDLVTVPELCEGLVRTGQMCGEVVEVEVPAPPRSRPDRPGLGEAGSGRCQQRGETPRKRPRSASAGKFHVSPSSCSGSHSVTVCRERVVSSCRIANGLPGAGRPSSTRPSHAASLPGSVSACQRAPGDAGSSRRSRTSRRWRSTPGSRGMSMPSPRSAVSFWSARRPAWPTS